MDKYIFLVLLIIFAGFIMWLNRKRNAVDVLFFNSTLAILALFMVGIIADDLTTWRYIVVSLALIATGEKIIGFFIQDKK